MEPIETGTNYDKIAQWWTDTQLKNRDYGMDYIRKAMGYVKDKNKFLDIGCGGTGRVIDEAIKNGFEVTAIDISSEMIKLATSKHPHVDFINDDFAQWETQDTYDLIIAWDSTFHAPISLQAKITIKMCNLLNSRGVLLFTSGAYAGEARGKMAGVPFEYGSIGYRAYLEIIEKMKCKPILMEEDQFPSGHLVVMCQKQ